MSMAINGNFLRVCSIGTELKIRLMAVTTIGPYIVRVRKSLKNLDGVVVKTTAIMVDFPPGKEVPSKVTIGFVRYRVRDYVAPPLRSYMCLAFGHVAIHCQKKTEMLYLRRGPQAHGL